MFRLRFALLALATVSSLAAAQRGGGGRGFGKTPDADYGARTAAGVRLSTGDVEDMNPVKLLLDKRKDLKLTDDQQKQLRAMVDQLRDSNKPTFKALDSLRTESRPRVDADASVERVRTDLVKESMRALIGTIRGSYAGALKGALSVLDPAQQSKADELVRKQAADAEETLTEKLGGGRGAGGGAGGRGRPPT